MIQGYTGRFAEERYLFLRLAGTSEEILLDSLECGPVWLLRYSPNLTKCLYQVPVKVRFFCSCFQTLMNFVDKCYLLLALR